MKKPDPEDRVWQEHRPPYEAMTDAHKAAWLSAYNELIKRRNKWVKKFFKILLIAVPVFLLICAVSADLAGLIFGLALLSLYLFGFFYPAIPWEENYRVDRNGLISFDLQYRDTWNGGNEKYPLPSKKMTRKAIRDTLNLKLGDPSENPSGCMGALGKLLFLPIGIFLFWPIETIYKVIDNFFWIRLFELEREKIFSDEDEQGRVHVAGPRGIQRFEASGGAPDEQDQT